MDLITVIIVLLITGTIVGFASGLLGVGGGFILVPIQFWVLIAMGVDQTIAIRVALGTSLAVILPTSISSAIGHYRRGVIVAKPALIIGISAFLGGISGGLVATHLPGDILRFIFGMVTLSAAIWLLISNHAESKKRSPGNVHYVLWGFLAGIMSGLLGIGGGILMVPILVIVMGFDFHKAIGTSTAVIVFSSIGGIISYTLGGFNVEGLPPYSIGYINLLQFLVIAGTSIPVAQIGVKIAHRLPARKLRYIFIFLLLYIALKMMGIFQWLNIPL